MLPLIGSFLKPIPDISVSNSSEHHYWSEFGHRFFSYVLQEFAGLDWRAMEVPVLASKYRKNYELDHSVYKVVEGNARICWLGLGRRERKFLLENKQDNH